MGDGSRMRKTKSLKRDRQDNQIPMPLLVKQRKQRGRESFPVAQRDTIQTISAPQRSAQPRPPNTSPTKQPRYRDNDLIEMDPTTSHYPPKNPPTQSPQDPILPNR